MRLDKLLSHSGYGSRKEVKALLKKKAVRVNGENAKSGSMIVDEKHDIVSVHGHPVQYQADYYWLLHKPTGVISATEDREQRTVMDLFKKEDYRNDLFPVGRLDKDTTGLLLITNDGDLAHQLLSPKKHVDKEYEAIVEGHVTENEVELFKEGLTIDGGETTRPAVLTPLSYDEIKNQSTIRLVIQEGKFHQVKRMFQAVGMKVKTLHRCRMGSLNLGDLPYGTYRALNEDEIQQLKESGK